MAAPKGNKNAKGNTGGKSLNDRQLAASVRSLALTEIQKYLEGKEKGYQDQDMKNAILLKLAPSLLPRLNEHTGEDGGDIEHRVIYLPQRNERVETSSPSANSPRDNTAASV